MANKLTIVSGCTPVDECMSAAFGKTRRMNNSEIIEWLTNSEERTEDEVFKTEDGSPLFAFDIAENDEITFKEVTYIIKG